MRGEEKPKKGKNFLVEAEEPGLHSAKENGENSSKL